MNNEMNNGTNNTNPSQGVDNSTNNQSVMVNNGQTVDSSQPVNNSQTMNMGNQPMNNQPVMNNQNFNGNLMPNSNQNNKKTLYIIIGVAVLIVIAVVVLLNVTNGNKSKGNTVNDFDNNGSNNQEEVSNNDDEDYDDDDSDYDDEDYDDDDSDYDDGSYVSSDSVTYKGFAIPKQNGYEYGFNNGSLFIENETFGTLVSIVSGDIANGETLAKEVFNEYKEIDCNVSNVKSDSYKGKKVYTFEVEDEGTYFIWYLMEADSGYLFTGLSANDKFAVDYKVIETTVSLLANAKYNGEYKLNSDKIEVINPKKLFE